MVKATLQRCFWCDDSEIYQHYHDTEWGMPVFDDIRLFEKLCLEGFQAGLSWLTVLKKREHFRLAFKGFDFHLVAEFTPQDIAELMKNEGIIRHRGKIEAVVHNAKLAVSLQEEWGSLAHYFWRYVVDVSNRPKVLSADYLRSIQPPPEAVALAKDLKKWGWKFVGVTTVYAFMQAMGLVNDHESDCFIRESVENAKKTLAATSGMGRFDAV